MALALLSFGTVGVSKAAFRLLLPPVDFCMGVILSSLNQMSSATLARMTLHIHAKNISAFGGIPWCSISSSSVNAPHVRLAPCVALDYLLKVFLESSYG